ncbi:Monocarboxylate transporter 3 [Exaiptasia diaphana]|nr:Monocarboxylate transporter 3 [Exaiptasia diaphana]
MFLCLLAGKICNRYGCRVSIIIGTISCIAALLVSSWATGMTYLFISLPILYGLGIALNLMACFLMVALYFDKNRHLALGFVAAGASAGYFVVAPIAQELISSFGWRNALRIESGMLLCCGIATIIVFDTNVEADPNGCADACDSSRCIRHEKKYSWNNLKKTLNFCSLYYSVSVTTLFIVSLSHYSLPIHLVRSCEEVGISSSKSSYLYIGIGIGSFVAKIAAGKLCQFVKPIYVNQASSLFSGISALTVSMSKSYIVLVIITVVFGLADGAFQSSYNSIALSTPDPQKRAYAYGGANMVISLAFVLGPMITGRIADLHSYKEAFIVSGVVTIVGALVPFVLCFRRDSASQTRTNILMEELVVFEKLSVV